MMRVFTAVDIEEKEVLSEISHVQDRFDLGLKPVKPEKMHITFEFFKNIEEEKLPELKSAMAQTDLKPFKAKIDGVGVFPSEDYIRVVWAGANSKKFDRLYSEISDHSLESANGYDFKPHITFLRVKDLSQDKKRKLKRTLREFEDHNFGKIKVNELKLYESKLKPSGSDYSLIHSEKL